MHRKPQRCQFKNQQPPAYKYRTSLCFKQEEQSIIRDNRGPCLAAVGPCVSAYKHKKSSLLFSWHCFCNEEGLITELYIPRKCIFTNRLITSKDHASVQINVGHLDENGVYNGHFSTFVLCGFVRAQGDVDSGLDRLWQKKKVEVRQQ
ncbi:hypothetical protein I3843_07G092000 [Carya illinoinensis]|uniref:40S ribosomal protein S21 n=1 Tax=Carya illinoinensis TaxID=32201 RepID=A0A8T1PZM6_CARIL|nr:hypothetical protein CIPAW_07G093300 [Carya illinoinensis]KAG7970592.1 hypothetical protein I3843_07G092000 [Carya illinoinensis]